MPWYVPLCIHGGRPHSLPHNGVPPIGTRTPPAHSLYTQPPALLPQHANHKHQQRFRKTHRQEQQVEGKRHAKPIPHLPPRPEGDDAPPQHTRGHAPPLHPPPLHVPVAHGVARHPPTNRCAPRMAV
eukprot:TRINITY_DN1711_c0_g1_i3.p2 TRINITY_DN1711_c0_g1~~TRINITY_DN1711_c0_g1_i3.p2  ORF type:complete len:127 (+),score=0.20 TRINITY_DN1711_c0_g1_i3:78-458(+)